MATINKPLNVDNPPKPAVAQQYPKVVVGNITRPSNGSTGFGRATPWNGCRKRAIEPPHQQQNDAGSQQPENGEQTHPLASLE